MRHTCHRERAAKDQEYRLGRLVAEGPQGISNRGQGCYGIRIVSSPGGGKARSTKPLAGFGGAGVLEIVEDHQTDTYRAVYTVKFSDLVYVLHAFQQKSKKGVATPKPDIDIIRQRLKIAEEDYKMRKTGRAHNR